jgi:hypothetical protein
LRTILTIIVGMLALSLQAQEIYTGAIAISPSQRTNSWRPTNTLAPGDSAKLSITVAQTGSYNGRNYTLHGNPIQHPPISSPPGSIIWRGNYSSLHACNAGNSPGTTTATVTAEWVETGSGGGGSGGSPSIIYGKATGIAQADIPVFSWSFDRRMQYADGTSPITYTVTGSITGRRVSMSPYSVKAISGELSVTNNTPESTNIRTGKITSTNSAKSKMGVYYGERELARSTNEIAFAKVDLIVCHGPGTNGGTPLPEDRLTNGGTAPATNELNPGTFVLLLPQDQTNRVATTLTLKADPTGGSVTLDQHGLTDLKIYSDAALQEELTLPKTWTNGDTPPSTLYMVGSSSSTNLESALGTLDLTYKANLAADGTEYNIKDTVGVNLLPVQIEEVSFGGTKYWELKSDDAATTYSAPQWKDVDGNGRPTNTAQGERDYAVAFTRKTKPQIGAKFKIASASNFGAIRIKATGPGGVAIPETSATVSGDVVTLPNDTEASAALVNTIMFYDKKDDAKAFKLEWELKIDNSDWSKIGTTKHTAYVTLDDPKTSLRQESLFEISCRNADGINQVALVTDAIWNEFTDRVVKRVDGLQLTYYNAYTCNYISTEDLLKFGDGQCGAWAKLFIDLRKVQGVDDTNEYVIFYPSGPSNTPIDYRGFVVKNWTFSGSGTSGVADFPYLNIPASNLVGSNNYNWRYAEVNDSDGIPGQGNGNPASLFNNHQVVIAGEYYDPSYGLKHASLAALDDNAIDGFYVLTSLPVDESSVNLDLNGDGDGDGDQTDQDIPTGVFVFRKNTSGLDLAEERANY